MSKKIATISDGEFRQLTSTALVKTNLVFFSASWSGQCRIIRPIVEAAVERYSAKLSIYELDIDLDPITPQNFGIQNVPTILILRGNQIVDRLCGMTNRDKLYELIESAIKESEKFNNLIAFSKKIAAGVGSRFNG
jgi:thioredoxin 1